eukprot:4809666-Amphidinium_carterae.2
MTMTIVTQASSSSGDEESIAGSEEPGDTCEHYCRCTLPTERQQVLLRPHCQLGDVWDMKGMRIQHAVKNRWTLREFASTDTTEFFAPTPEQWVIDLLHARAAKKSQDITFIDISRAFLHAPEEDWVFIHPPAEAFLDECPENLRLHDGEVWVALTKLNGRRDGRKGYYKYTTTSMVEKGFKVSKLHPNVFFHKELQVTIAAHVDDWVVTSPPQSTQKVLEMLKSSFWLK